MRGGQLLRVVGVEVAGRDDDVGVDVAAVVVDGAFEDHASLPSPRRLMSGVAMWPATAEAAATYGLARYTSLAGVAHAAHEVAVGGGHGPLALGQDAHVPAQAGAAGRRAEGAARLDERLHGAVGGRVQAHLLRAREDDGAHVGVHLAAAQDVGRLRRSSMRPLVQEPMTTWSIVMSAELGRRRPCCEGRCGLLTCGTAATSTSMTRAYSASGSLANTWPAVRARLPSGRPCR